MTTHTAAPWNAIHRRVVERPWRIKEHYAIMPIGGPTFAVLPDGKDADSDIQAANAKLISAAPDLLAACKAAFVHSTKNPMSPLPLAIEKMLGEAIEKGSY